MKLSLLKVALFMVPFFVFGSIYFSSCSSHAESTAFSSKLMEADTYIGLGDTKEAMDLLRNLEKKAFAPQDRIGIYKRYILMGERKSGRRVLENGLKKLPENLELNALYSHFLLEEGEYSNACIYGEKLIDTAYSGIYAQAVITKAKEGKIFGDELFGKNYDPKRRKKDPVPTEDDIRDIFHDTRICSIYSMAYDVSKDVRFLYDSTLNWLETGNYKNASAIYPHFVLNLKDSVFWGTVLYDCGLHAESVLALDSGLKKKVDSDSIEFEKTALVLASDNYYVLQDEERSEECRNSYLMISDVEDNFRPIVLANSCGMARRNGDILRQYDLSNTLVKDFPFFEPALAFYGTYALDRLMDPKEDQISGKLRNAGLKTIKMEERDRIPLVSVDQVVAAVNYAIENNYIPEYAVLLETITDREKFINHETNNMARIWSLLERYCGNQDSYSPEIARYVLEVFFRAKKYDDACSFFQGYIQDRYGSYLFEDDSYVKPCSLWEKDYAAWFYAKNGNLKGAERIWTHIIETVSGKARNLSEEKRILFEAYVNLAELCVASTRESQAITFLNSAQELAPDSKTKADVLYRIARVASYIGDNRTASRTLQYCLQLDSSHTKARLLQKKL